MKNVTPQIVWDVKAEGWQHVNDYVGFYEHCSLKARGYFDNVSFVYSLRATIDFEMQFEPQSEFFALLNYGAMQNIWSMYKRRAVSLRNWLRVVMQG